MVSVGAEVSWGPDGHLASFQEQQDGEVKLARPMEGAHSFEWLFEETEAVASPGFKELFGIPDEEPLTSEAVMARVHPEDAGRVMAGQEAALQRDDPFEDEFRILMPDGSIRWILARGRALTSESGRIVGLAGVNLDITQRKVAELKLARREQALRERELMFRTLANTMPQMVWSARPNGYHDYFNDRWYEFTGVEPGSTDGAGWNEIFHPDDRGRARELWHRALETGSPYEIEYRLRHHSGVYRWTLGRALPVFDEDGAVLRWFGTCTDIHDSKSHAEMNVMLGQELKHRIKNIFSVVQSLISLTSRRYPEARSYARDLQSKVASLARTHTLIQLGSKEDQQQERLTLHQLLNEILTPYPALDDMRIHVEGQDVLIGVDAVTPLTLVFHELATNSSKYGSLSSPQGRLTIAVRESGSSVQISWRETGGPSINGEPPHVGFGTQLSSVAVEGQLKGWIRRHWLPEGLNVEIVVPVSHLV